jgi:hypothetical protein
MFLSLTIKIKSMSDMLDLCLEPVGSPPCSHQHYLLVPGRSNVVSLKQYLIQKLGLRDSSPVELLCNEYPVGDQFSLSFISRYWSKTDDEVLLLKYRLQEEGNTS